MRHLFLHRSIPWLLITAPWSGLYTPSARRIWRADLHLLYNIEKEPSVLFIRDTPNQGGEIYFSNFYVRLSLMFNYILVHCISFYHIGSWGHEPRRGKYISPISMYDFRLCSTIFLSIVFHFITLVREDSRVGKGISAQASHRTVRETLTSHGSSNHHPCRWLGRLTSGSSVIANVGQFLLWVS